MDNLNEHLPISELKKLVYDLLSEINNPEDDALVKKGKKNDLLKKYSSKYAALQLRYPALFNMILDTGKNFDLQQFEMMIGMIQKVRDNKVSEQEASVEFGQKMVDKYVTPKLDNIEKK
jgi:hypothetical protein